MLSQLSAASSSSNFSLQLLSISEHSHSESRYATQKSRPCHPERLAESSTKSCRSGWPAGRGSDNENVEMYGMSLWVVACCFKNKAVIRIKLLTTRSLKSLETALWHLSKATHGKVSRPNGMINTQLPTINFYEILIPPWEKRLNDTKVGPCGKQHLETDLSELFFEHPTCHTWGGASLAESPTKTSLIGTYHAKNTLVSVHVKVNHFTGSISWKRSSSFRLMQLTRNANEQLNISKYID